MRFLPRFFPQRHPLLEHFESSPALPRRTPVKDCRFIVIDFELTGLDPRRDHIVSVGWVPVANLQIVLTEARHYLVKSPVSVGQSATIHGLHDRHLKSALPLEEVLQEFMTTYAGYVPVAHYAALDKTVLERAIKRWLGRAPRLEFIDTMQLERRRLERQGEQLSSAALRLDQCLARHKLPAIAPHQALEDAYGCALLLLSQIKSARANDFTLAELRRASR